MTDLSERLAHALGLTPCVCGERLYGRHDDCLNCGGTIVEVGWPIVPTILADIEKRGWGWSMMTENTYLGEVYDYANDKQWFAYDPNPVAALALAFVAAVESVPTSDRAGCDSGRGRGVSSPTDHPGRLEGR